MPPVDPNEVLMTGENSFVRLSSDGGKTLTDRTSHWRVLWCPAGAGHALFIQSTLTDGKIRVYSDNIAVARWLQKTIESVLFPAFADTSLPVIAATFARHGIAGGAVYDALVALASVEHGATLATRDARARVMYEQLGAQIVIVA